MIKQGRRLKMRKEEYSTKNLNIASYLYASGVQFAGSNNINGEFFFKFTPKDKAEQLVQLYFSGAATVNPRELFSRLHDLKDIIFSGSLT